MDKGSKMTAVRAHSRGQNTEVFDAGTRILPIAEQSSLFVAYIPNLCV